MDDQDPDVRPRRARRPDGLRRVHGTHRLIVSQSVPASDRFADRHIGPRDEDIRSMLSTLGFDSLEVLADQVVPADIRLRRPLALPAAATEEAALAELSAMAAKNE